MRFRAASGADRVRTRAHLKRTNKSYRVDETYIRIKGQDRYLYTGPWTPQADH
jgi:transposase-like protein